MAKRKGKRSAPYDPFTALRLICLTPDLEPLAHTLYEQALQGSKPLWGDMNPELLRNDPKFRGEFLRLSHAGMKKAQEGLIELVSSNENLTDSQSALLYGIADAIAWQLLGNQLCYARRYYKWHDPVDLKSSNFESVVIAANSFMDKDEGGFALISDLTSFIQVGDLLAIGSAGGLHTIEVKEGRKNHDIMEFMNFFMESGCPQAFQFFAKEHGESGVKQLQRMFRQVERMGHVTEIMSTGRSEDPDTQQKIHIPEDTYYLGDWTEKLVSVLEKSDERGWAIDVVDECLYIGSYASDSMRNSGHAAFNLWFDEMGGTPECPRFRLIECMKHPLAPPIFTWAVSDKHKFDILFGRKNVCLGLNVSAFIEKLKKEGLSVREATNREASMLDQRGMPPYRHLGKVILVSDGDREVALNDGVFLRVLFHRQNPVETVKVILGIPFEEE